MRLYNNIAVVTGASKGIGKATALGLAQEGADVLINCRSDAASAGQEFYVARISEPDHLRSYARQSVDFRSSSTVWRRWLRF